MSAKTIDQNEVYKMKAHGPWITTAGKKWCFSCGLVALNNKASEWCVEKGCLYDLHPQYKSRMRKLTRGKR